MIPTKARLLLAAAVMVVNGFVSDAQAHHSTAAIVAVVDRQNPVSLAGTVKEFRLSNPHTWILLMVPDANGGETLWELEGAPVNMVVRQGWNSRTLVPGMKVRLLIAPRKDGAAGGEWLRLLETGGQPSQSQGR